MISRRLHAQILHDLSVHTAVALLGPRQVGKTTLARAIAATAPSIYLDLEDPADRDKLADPVLFLDGRADKLVVIDEIPNAPDPKFRIRSTFLTRKDNRDRPQTTLCARNSKI